MAVTSRVETTETLEEPVAPSVMNRLIEFAQFKGETEGQLTALTAAIGAVSEGLHKRLDDLNATMNRRLDRQDGELTEIRTQTTKTNGRVTTIEQDRETERVLDAVEAKQAEKDAQEEAEVAAKRQSRRMWLFRAIWGVAAIGLGGGLTDLLSRAFG